LRKRTGHAGKMDAAARVANPESRATLR
jgi:hypothetical protein